MSASNSTDPLRPTPKILGGDIETGCHDPFANGDRGERAARLTLAFMPGVPAGRDPNDNSCAINRVYYPESGASSYLDLKHLEVTIPEVASARQYAAYTKASYLRIRDATRLVNRERKPGEEIRHHANNTDYNGSSYGGHVNTLMHRTAFNTLLEPGGNCYLPFLASVKASSVVVTGAGKAGTEPGLPAVDFQLAQRADFMMRLHSLDTTKDRGMLNTRDESLSNRCIFARKHTIFFDTTMMDRSVILRGALAQMHLAMSEAAAVDPLLIFENPVAACHAFSRDPSLRAKCRLISGMNVTAVDHQMMLHQRAAEFCERGGFDHSVAEAPWLLDLWRESLEWLAARDFDRASRCIDWVAKMVLIERAVVAKGGEWDGPEAKAVDLMWSNLDGGLYQRMKAAGLVERLISDAEIEDALCHPPEQTRAYARAHALRALLASEGVRVTGVNWYKITFCRGRRHAFEILMDDPTRGKASVGDLEGADLPTIMDALGARRIEPWQLRQPKAQPARTSSRAGVIPFSADG